MKIEPVVMDYEGEPVTIINGEIFDAYPPRDVWSDRLYDYVDTKEVPCEVYWDSDECDWKVELLDVCGNDARDYGTGWYDCNTDWRSW